MDRDTEHGQNRAVSPGDQDNHGHSAKPQPEPQVESQAGPDTGPQDGLNAAAAPGEPGEAGEPGEPGGAGPRGDGPPRYERRGPRVRPQTGPVPILGCDVPHDYGTMVQYATTLSRATVGVPQPLQGSPENVIAVMTIARALQLPLATVMQNVYETRDPGQVGQRSRLLHMLARRAGHRIELEYLDDRMAVVLLWLHDRKDAIEVTYTLWEAHQLGLTDPQRDIDGHWRRQPANMLRNRVISRAVDWHCPEVKMGADWAADGGLLIQGINAGQELHLTGLGPEVERILDQVAAAEQLPDEDRHARLREIWDEARLLRDTVVDEEGTTVGRLLAAHLAAAAGDPPLQAPDHTPRDDGSGDGTGDALVQPGPGEVQERMARVRRLLQHRAATPAQPEPDAGPPPRPADPDRPAARPAPVVAGFLSCGCPVDLVERTGRHAPVCVEVTARLLREEADRR